jgi:putative PIN family toxin of toxin-antitoxin system
MIRAVLDSNILIRALIRPQSAVGVVLRRLRAGDYVLIYSLPLLDELLAKLVLPRIRDKYHVDDAAIEALLGLLALRGELVAPVRRVKACRDPKDDMVLEAAVAGNADYVVTADEDLLVLKRFERARIVPCDVFLRAL